MMVRGVNKAALGGIMALGLGLFATGLGAAPLLPLPGPAAALGERQVLLADLNVPVGPWRNGTIKTVSVEGQLSQTAWRLDDTDLTTLEMMQTLRAQLRSRGYEIVYECRTRSCGGFDFRFNINVLPEPEMHVDLGDFRFLSARRLAKDENGTDDAGNMNSDFVTLMVSRSYRTGFVQITHVAPPDSIRPLPVLSTRSADAMPETGVSGQDAGVTGMPAAPYTAAIPGVTGPLSAELEQGGAIALDDLTFEVGSANLGPGPFPSLNLLADYLLRNQERRVTLVGHSDSVGGLDRNIALSRRRAEAVMAVLAHDYAVPKAQMDAAGVGFLAPRASNRTDDGRALNRRVEVVLTSLD